jgi:hypothetical protein
MTGKGGFDKLKFQANIQVSLKSISSFEAKPVCFGEL